MYAKKITQSDYTIIGEKTVENRLFGKICLLFFVTASFFSITCITPAMAHKVTVFAWVEGDQVFTESKLSGGKRVAAGDITVYDASNNVLLKGKTNDQGEFSFKLPQKPPLIIELNAGMGHQAKWTIQPDDVDDDTFPAGNDPEKDIIASEPVKTAPSVDRSAELNTADLEAVVERVLDKKLKPVIRLLVDTRQNEPSLSEIIGGIGYIMGIVGIIAYFQSRSPKRDK